MIDNKYLATGDMVFILSIGRPDLGGKAEEWSKLLYNTLKTKIVDLNDDVLILPGHYMEWREAIRTSSVRHGSETRSATHLVSDATLPYLSFVGRYLLHRMCHPILTNSDKSLSTE